MPKQKTKKSATKRMKKSATGKILRTCGGKAHLASCKTRKRKRNLRGMKTLDKTVNHIFKRMLSTH
ncbi:MAG: 50S ribosomal protein L35 [Kiritimatiellae bacterium]|nr:50S ribosomal protein L35 [Kiritimatiellia bacterium]